MKLRFDAFWIRENCADIGPDGVFQQVASNLLVLTEPLTTETISIASNASVIGIPNPFRSFL